MKTLNNLKTYKKALDAKNALEKCENEIKSAKGNISTLRKELAKNQRLYSDSLNNESIPFEEVEQMDIRADEIKEELHTQAEKLKELESTLPELKTIFEQANKAFISEAVPLVDEVIEDAKSKALALKNANENLLELRKSAKDTTLDDMPLLSEYISDNPSKVLKFQEEKWQRWKARFQ